MGNCKKGIRTDSKVLVILFNNDTYLLRTNSPQLTKKLLYSIGKNGIHFTGKFVLFTVIDLYGNLNSSYSNTRHPPLDTQLSRDVMVVQPTQKPRDERYPLPRQISRGTNQPPPSNRQLPQDHNRKRPNKGIILPDNYATIHFQE